jgi:ABC-2 type transport system ATP-binding protein
MWRPLVLASLLVLASTAPAAARDAVVRSFDGTELHVSFHAAKPGKRAPTILMTHGWGGRRERSPDSATGDSTVGTAALRKAGFNVLTWDSRGFGDSGGTVTIDYWKNEGRDVKVLLNWLARQREAKLDRRRDPRVGMHGGSYAGGIQFVAAAIDRRIDAITPSIAWHSLLTALYREETVKGGWSSLLYAAGQTGRLDPHITSAFGSGATTGKLSAEDRAWFKSRGPGPLVKRIEAPTLILQGTPDTLFTPSEAIDNYRILRRQKVPVKMLWFCGGHGQCLTGGGTAGHLERRVIAWLERYVQRRKKVRTGPRFEWLADDAVWRRARSFPPRAGTPVVGEGSGTLIVSPADTLSGSPIAAGPAANAVNIPIAEATAQVVGEPRLRLTYSGTGTATHVFAQIVDESRNIVLGSQVTPVPVRLDGASHTVTRSLEGVAASLAPGRRYRLQLIGGTQVYGPARGVGTIAFSAARISLPTASP